MHPLRSVDGCSEMSYPGGKNGSGVYQTLINLMPPHECYVEPFLGGGAILRAKLPAKINVGVDVDRAALNLAMTPAGSPWQNILPSKGYGRNWHVFMNERVRFEFICGNGIDVLEHQRWPESTLVYADPPYLKSARRDRVGDIYRYEMTDAQHLELLSVLKALRCMVMISGYSSALYAKELKGWHATAFQAATRGRPAAEWVWCNYPRPEVLHDYRFLGDNFRQREHLKRMIARWTAKLQKMPPVKRQALLAAIANTAGSGDGTR